MVLRPRRLPCPAALAAFLALAVTPFTPKALLSQRPAGNANLSPLLVGDEVFKMGGNSLMENFGYCGFRWTDERRQIARSNVRGLTLGGRPVGETLVYFAAGAARQVEVSIYNRGDDGPISPASYDGRVEEWREIITQVAGVEPGEAEADPQSAVRADGQVWSVEGAAYTLEYSASGSGSERTPEFIRLRYGQVQAKSFLQEKIDGGAAGTVAVQADDLEDNVYPQGRGSVIRGVPMVDQGQKGYCVVASASRIFNYLGVQVTMHELAQLAGSDPNAGTSTSAMVEEVRGVAPRYRTRIRPVIDHGVEDWIKMIENYNRVAKRADSPLLSTGRMIDVAGLYQRSDPEVLKEAQLRNRGDLGKFQREIEEKVDEGVPLLWCLQLGLYPEEGRTPQGIGGHARLIIGYDWEAEEGPTIYFSDSWGQGHEMKRMGLEDAFAATTSLHVIEPTR